MSRNDVSDDGCRSGKRRTPGWGVAVVVVAAVAAGAAAVGSQQRTLLPVASVQSPNAVSRAVHRTESSPEAANGQEFSTVTATAHYVGSSACAACHSHEAGEWRTSQHHDAMAEATAATVLADFNDTTFTHAGVTSKFFRRDGKFLAQTSGLDGKLHDYRITYTYGLYPLQQYLVEFPDGRLQPLPIAWDTRTLQQGGQRWLHLYPDEDITHNDELFWTRPSQNWNYMCADCHSTNVRKNYDSAVDTFRTTWSEINVGCEACHGPGSHHLEWAELKREEKPAGDYDNRGLSVHLDERNGVTWTVNPKTGNSARSEPRKTDHEIQVCAQCHSRRGQIADGYQAGKPFLDYYRPALLVPPLYHADGQQQDEVYTWASFLQSNMYASGVTCSDCHNPHSGKLRATGNTVCATCHLSDKYDTERHSHHKPGGAGGQCAACHMPTTNYMVVDPRHDHSIRVPRPDQSVEFGVPNACNQCHTGRSASWAQAQIEKWYGHDPQGFQHYTAAFAAANGATPDAQSQLQVIAGDPTQPAIVRATALSRLDPGSRGAAGALVEALRDPNGLIRLGALESLEGVPADALALLVAPLLSDPLRTIRIEAANVLASVSAAQLEPAARTQFEHAASEHVASQHYNADRAEARVNLGSFYANRGDVGKAEREMQAALRLNPRYVPAYVNLADLYRATDRDADGERLLVEGLRVAPGHADLHYALGLTLVRRGQADAALGELRRATELAPRSARFAYVYAAALESSGQSAAAIATLERALLIHPDDRDILEALVSFHAARGEPERARAYAERLGTLPDTGRKP